MLRDGKMDMYVFLFQFVNKSPDVRVGLSDTSGKRVVPAFYGVPNISILPL